MDLDAHAAEIIAQIPPLSQLEPKPAHTTGQAPYETPKDSLLHTMFTQQYQEPEWRFLDRCECYWRRGCAMKLVQAMHLENDQERELIRACWLKLKLPSEQPRWPEFGYGEPARRDPTIPT